MAISDPTPAWPTIALPVVPAAQLPGFLQQELTIGASDDPMEREADRVSDQAAAPPGGLAAANLAPHGLPAASEAARGSDSAPASVLAVLAGGGRPMEPPLRQDMEQSFGHDFSRVRVFADAPAQRSARDVGANAYAVGPNIVFGADQYAPATPRGRRLIAHELTHVVQQSGADRLRPGTARAAPPFGLGGIGIPGRSSPRVARNNGPPVPPGSAVPPELSFLTPAEIAKLRAFGDADFQISIRTLLEKLWTTKGYTEKGYTQQYVDIRQAAGELRIFRDYLNNPEIAAAKIVKSNMGDRSPDLYVRYRGGDERRVEVSNITLASKDVRPEPRANKDGSVGPKITTREHPDDPTKTIVDLPVADFKDSKIKAQIRNKIRPKGVLPSQLDAQNSTTVAAGKPMETGGDVVVSITHAKVDKTRLDDMMRELEAELVASSARRVQIDAIDAADPRGGRRIFEYNREGEKFLPKAARPLHRPGPVQPPPVSTPRPSEGKPATPEPAAPKSDAPPKPAAPKSESAPGAGEPVHGVKPGAGEPVPAVKPGAGEPHAPGRAGGRRLAGAVKFAGPMVLDMVTAYYVNKHEQRVIATAITAKVASSDVKSRVVEEVEKHRLDIAYEQLRGATVYATVELRMTLTNDIMDELQLKAVTITDSNQSSSMSSVMSHDAIGSEYSTRWDTISMPIPPIALTKSEELKLRLRLLDTPIMSGGPAPDAAARAKLVTDISTAETEEAKERDAEIARPRVIADPKDRAKQQADLIERIRKQNGASAPASSTAPSPAAKSQPGLLAPPGGGVVGRAAADPAGTSDPAGGFPSFLPGAGGPGPVEKAAAAVKAARTWTLAVHAKGAALEGRLGGADRPTDADRQGWVAEEARWRVAMKAFMNHFQNELRYEAVSALGQLVDEYGPKLAQIHVHLVG